MIARTMPGFAPWDAALTRGSSKKSGSREERRIVDVRPCHFAHERCARQITESAQIISHPTHRRHAAVEIAPHHCFRESAIRRRARCSCELINPGSANRPFTSTTSAPSGMCNSATGTTASIRSPRHNRHIGARRPRRPSITSAPEYTITFSFTGANSGTESEGGGDGAWLAVGCASELAQKAETLRTNETCSPNDRLHMHHDGTAVWCIAPPAADKVKTPANALIYTCVDNLVPCITCSYEWFIFWP